MKRFLFTEWNVRQNQTSVCYRGFLRGKKRFLLYNAHPRDILFLLYSNYSRTTYYVRADSIVLFEIILSSLYIIIIIIIIIAPIQNLRNFAFLC